MHTKSGDFDNGFARGWDQGRAALTIELRTNTPKTQQQFYDLTPHDLDTIAMGIALVVLHAADIQTIAVTMETQRKMGVAEKVLGWLHLIASSPTEYTRQISLYGITPNPWLNPYELTEQDRAAADQLFDYSEAEHAIQHTQELDDEAPY